jgi:hypothetical protein
MEFSAFRQSLNQLKMAVEITALINTQTRGPVGPAGTNGTDASVTAANVATALEAMTDAQQGDSRDAIKAAELRVTDRSPAYRAALYNGGSNARPNLFFFGDSMIALAKSVIQSQVAAYGAISGYGLLNGTAGGGGSVESDACVKWITGEAFLLTASGHYVEFAENGTNAVEANSIRVYAYRSPTGGTFKVQLSVNGGAWTDEVTGISTAGTLGSFVTTITKTAYATNYKVRCVWTSGNPVSIIGCGMRDSRKLGPIVSFASNSSDDDNNIDNAALTARAITDPVFADIAPNLLILSHLDGATIVNSSQATLQDNLSAGVVSTGAPAPSWLIIGPPIGYNDAADAVRAAQQDAQMELASSRGDSFFDCRTWAMPVSTVVSRGLITDTTHYTTLAQTLWIPTMFREMGLCDGPLSGPSSRTSYDIIGGGLFEADSTAANPWTSTGTAHSGFLKLRGSSNGLVLEDRTGAASTSDFATLYYSGNVLYFDVFFASLNNLGQAETIPVDSSLNTRLGNRTNRWGIVYSGGVSTATTTKSSAYTATEKDHTILVNAASAGVTITIPAAAAANSGWVFLIKKIDSSGNAVTIGGTVDGAASPTITSQWDYRRIQSDGSAWYRVG